MPLVLRALFLLYSISIETIVWCVLVPIVWVRARLTGAGPSGLLEYLAFVPAREAATRPTTGPVLVHAVSLGEMHAVAPLVAELAAEGRRIWLTTGNAAGLEAARRLARVQPAIEHVSYLPWDRRAVRGWLSATAPSAVVILETEIWPNLFRACGDLEIPLFIANGRIRRADVPRYRLLRPFFARVLDNAAWIGAQSAADRDRFLAIGAPASRLEVAGNLKFDAVPAASVQSEARTSDGSDRPLIVAGSTHDPEERWLIECIRLLAERGRPTRLVLAPRAAARAGGIVRLARSLGLRARLWSEPSDDVCDVVVLDRYGILRGCYAAADVAVVGGTFVPIGGHNILEPALMARPILVGPHTGEIAAVVEPFADAGALMRVAGADPSRALADACTVLFADRVLARTMGEKAAALCRLGAGSAARHARVIVAGPSSGRWPQEARTWWRPTPRAPQCPATAESHRAD